MKLLTALTATLLLTAALACTCAPPDFEAQYCSSITSIRGKVLARFDNCPGTCHPFNDQFNGRITYVVKVQRLFRGDAPEDGIVHLKTRVNGALCGTILNIGKSYLFNLRVKKVDTCPKDFWDISSCDNHRIWQTLTKAEKSFVIENANTGQSLCP